MRHWSGIRPSVSVIVPCYRYGHWLEGCVQSILDQSGVDVRVLVLDDASPDDTALVASRLARHDRRVEWRHHETNQGHIATYNEGLAWADGDYTALLSADDLLAPGALTRAAQLMERQPGVGLVYGVTGFFEDNDEIRHRRRPHGPPKYWRGHDWIRERCRAGTNPITSPEVVVRTSVQHAVGGYRPELPHTGDLEMWLRIAAVSDVAFLRGATQAYHRVHPASMMRTDFSGLVIDRVHRRDAFESFFESDGHRLADLDECRHAARTALARDALIKANRAYDRGRVATVPVDELVAFAAETDPHWERLVTGRTLRVRRALGPRIAPWMAPFQLTGLGQYLRYRARQHTVRWRGA